MRMRHQTRRGQATSEWGLALALIAVVSIAALTLVSGGVGNIFSTVASSIVAAPGSSDSTPAPSGPAALVSDSSPAAGSSITVTGSGFAPNSTVYVYLHSDPLLLGTTLATDEGNVSPVVNIPAGVILADHSISLEGVRQTADPLVESSTPFTIVAPTPTPVPDPMYANGVNTGASVHDGMPGVAWTGRPTIGSTLAGSLLFSLNGYTGFMCDGSWVNTFSSFDGTNPSISFVVPTYTDSCSVVFTRNGGETQILISGTITWDETNPPPVRTDNVNVGASVHDGQQGVAWTGRPTIGTMINGPLLFTMNGYVGFMCDGAWVNNYSEFGGTRPDISFVVPTYTDSCSVVFTRNGGEIQKLTGGTITWDGTNPPPVRVDNVNLGVSVHDGIQGVVWTGRPTIGTTVSGPLLFTINSGYTGFMCDGSMVSGYADFGGTRPSVSFTVPTYTDSCSVVFTRNGGEVQILLGGTLAFDATNPPPVRVDNVNVGASAHDGAQGVAWTGTPPVGSTLGGPLLFNMNGYTGFMCDGSWVNNYSDFGGTRPSVSFTVPTYTDSCSVVFTRNGGEVLTLTGGTITWTGP